MSEIKRLEVVRPEYSFEYIHPVLGRLALPIAMIKVMVKCTKSILWGSGYERVSCSDPCRRL